jgi:hypothetical protein
MSTKSVLNGGIYLQTSGPNHSQQNVTTTELAVCSDVTDLVGLYLADVCAGSVAGSEH